MTTQEQKTILLVEDEAIIAIAEARTIKQFGYEVLTASSGEKAIELAMADNNIDLILMDIDLGKGINGPGAALQILKRRTLPIVFLTSHSEREMVERVRGITRYGYVIKNSGDFVMQSSIEMAFDLFDAYEKLENELSARNRAEEAHRENAERMRAIVEGTPHLFFYTQDAEANTTYVSPTVEHITGHKADVWLKRKDWFITETAMNLGVKEKTRAHLRGEFTGESLLLEIRHAIGHPILLEVYEYPITKNGKVVGLQGVAHDITDRKLAEETLRESEERLKRFAEASFEGIGVIQNGIILEANEQLGKMMRCSVSDLIGNSVMGFVASELREAVQVLMRSENDKTSELLALAADGTIFPVEVRGRSVSYHGRQVRMVVLRDITERKQTEISLRASEEKYRLLFENNPLPMWAFDMNSLAFLAVNDFAVDHYGYTREEFLNMTIKDIRPPDDIPYLIGVLNNGKGPVRKAGTVRHRKKDGSLIDVDITGHEMEFEGHRATIVLAIDITERKRAEAAVRASEQQLKFYIDNAGDAIYVMETETGRIRNCNGRACLDLRYSMEELLGLSAKDIECRLNPGEVDAIHRDLKPGEVRTIDGAHKRKDGSVFPVEIRLSSLAPAQPELMLAMARDITERKRVEDGLHNERILLRALIDNIPDSIYSKDLACRKTLANRTDVHILGGKSEAEVLGKDDFEFYPKELAEKFFADDQSVIQSGNPVFNREEYILDEKDQKRWLLTSKLPWRDKDNQVIGLIGIGRDITERKRAEEQIKNLLTEKELLLHEVHHRVKNNMNTMMSLLSLQADSLKSTEGVVALNEAKDRMRSMLVLYEKLYRSENLREISLKSYLTLLADEVIDNFPNKAKVTVNKRIDDFALDVKILSPLGMIINELLSNIMKYAFVGRDGGVITLSALREDKYVTIIVQDDGVGIPESIDIDTSSSFGIQLVAMLTKQLDGTMRIERGNGTKFVLEFEVKDDKR